MGRVICDGMISLVSEQRVTPSRRDSPHYRELSRGGAGAEGAEGAEEILRSLHLGRAGCVYAYIFMVVGHLDPVSSLSVKSSHVLP